MSSAATAAGVSDVDLVLAIEASMAGENASRSPVRVHRRASEYATSAPLEHVTAEFPDGPSRDFILKHLAPRQLMAGARRAKPAFVIDPCREIEVYRTLLAPVDVGPRLIGFASAPESATYWLLTEYVHGREMYQIGELDRWGAVAGWLAALHERFARIPYAALARQARLIDYNHDWYMVWLNRALRFFASDDSQCSRRRSSALRWLAQRYYKVVDHLLSLPVTIIHGEFYPSNVLVTDDSRARSVYPVDWEMTATGPGVIDLAALAAGDWRDADRRALIAAYVRASTPDGTGVEEMAQSVAYAQIHLAVQWLGWFGRRRAPAGHTRDWLGDAIDRAEALGL